MPHPARVLFMVRLCKDLKINAIMSIQYQTNSDMMYARLAFKNALPHMYHEYLNNYSIQHFIALVVKVALFINCNTIRIVAACSKLELVKGKTFKFLFPEHKKIWKDQYFSLYKQKFSPYTYLFCYLTDI